MTDKQQRAGPSGDDAEGRDLRARIDRLGREVYGVDFEKFLETPRGSLNWETPAALLDRGDRLAVELDEAFGDQF